MNFENESLSDDLDFNNSSFDYDFNTQVTTIIFQYKNRRFYIDEFYLAVIVFVFAVVIVKLSKKTFFKLKKKFKLRNTFYSWRQRLSL